MMPERRSPPAGTCLPRPADRRGIAAGSAGLLSQLVFTAGWLTAGTWQPPGYSPVKDTISDLMARTAPHALVPLVTLMLAGAGTAAFALAGLRPALAAAGRVAAYAPWFLGFSALGLGNLLSFAQIPCQAGVGCTLHQAMSGFGGTVDATGGVIVAIVAAVAPFPMARRMRNVAGWQRLARPSLLAGVMMFTCLVASGLGATAPVHGLLQRAAATTGAIWAAVLAANLIRVSCGAGAGQRVTARRPRSPRRELPDARTPRRQPGEAPDGTPADRHKPRCRPGHEKRLQRPPWQPSAKGPMRGDDRRM
jgi:hypothetical protein